MRTLLAAATITLTLALGPGAALGWSGIPDGVSHLQGGPGPDGGGGGDMSDGPGGDMSEGPSHGGGMPDDGGHHGGGTTPVGQGGDVKANMYVCRLGNAAKNDPTGLYWHLVGTDANGVELDDKPTDTACTKLNQINGTNPFLPAGFVDANNVQVKQAVSECRNGKWHVITYDLTVSPRKEIGDQATDQDCAT